MPQQYNRPNQVCRNCRFIAHINGLDCYLCLDGSNHFVTCDGMANDTVYGGALSRGALEDRVHRVPTHLKHALAHAVQHHPEVREVIINKLHRHNYLQSRN